MLLKADCFRLLLPWLTPHPEIIEKIASITYERRKEACELIKERGRRNRLHKLHGSLKRSLDIF